MINNNTLRIGGLASGMNTDEIVGNLVKAQSSRLNKMQQTKIMTTWKSDAYRDVNKKINEFRKAIEGLRLDASFNKLTSSDSRIEVMRVGNSTQSEFIISEAVLATSEKEAMVSFDSKMANGSSNIGASDISFNLNGVAITLTANMTFDQAIAEINKSSDQTNVKASNVNGWLDFTSISKGSIQKVEITGATSNTLSIANTLVNGSDTSSGRVIINGKQIVSSSNTFTYEDVTFNIKGTITAGSSVKVGSDTQGIFDSIKTFVDKYNELIADFNGRLTEKRYRDYQPLLEDQKKDMKENDIKLWEKSKSGLLTNDSTIRTFLTEMRNSLLSVVGNPKVSTSFNSLKAIGIDFTSNYKDKGKLILDESKIKRILQTNLEDVQKLFAIKVEGAPSSSTTVTDSNIHKDSGFAKRIYDRINVTITQLGKLAGSPNSTVDTQSYIAKQLNSLDSNINREQDKIYAYEDRLWRQFTAMEKGLQQLNSQGAWLSQQLG
jgi:flagellar hook-associated protein 2